MAGYDAPSAASLAMPRYRSTLLLQSDLYVRPNTHLRWSIATNLVSPACVAGQKAEARRLAREWLTNFNNEN